MKKYRDEIGQRTILDMMKAYQNIQYIKEQHFIFFLEIKNFIYVISVVII